MCNSDANPYTIDKLLHLADEAIDRQELSLAQQYLERATSSNRGRLRYSQFLIAHPPEDMSVEKRIAKIEKLLLYVERNGNPEESGAACSMLADFYSRQKDKPLRSLGFMLRSSRMKAKINEFSLQNLQRRISSVEISELQTDLLGSYVCGIESRYYPDPAVRQWSRRFLETVAESGAIPLAGLAAMHMADLLQEEPFDDTAAIGYWKKKSADYGNPDVLTK